MARAMCVWRNVKLPTWDGDRTFELFQLVSSGTANADQHAEYVQLLMVLIDNDLGRKNWVKRLTKRGVDPQDCAQRLLTELNTKTVEGRYKLRTPVMKVLMGALHTTITRVSRRAGEEICR